MSIVLQAQSLVEVVQQVAQGSGPIRLKDAREIHAHQPEVEGVAGAPLAELLGPRLPEYLEAFRIAAHSDRLVAELVTVDLNGQSATAAQLCDLKKRIEGQKKIDPELGVYLENSAAWTHLVERCAEEKVAGTTLSFPTTEGVEACAVKGRACEAVRKVVAMLSKQLGPGITIGVRGGSLEEALGWYVQGATGDPRVAESVYTRRTGAKIPVYDLTAAARGAAGPTKVDQCAEDAACYARSGTVYENISRALKAEGCAHPTAEDIRQFPIEAIDTDLSKGVLMLFAAPTTSFQASSHRTDPNWGKDSYKHVVTMGDGERHLIAMIPVPDHKEAYYPGAFAVLVTEQLRALPRECKERLFAAAFSRMDRTGFDRELKDGILAAERRVA